MHRRAGIIVVPRTGIRGLRQCLAPALVLPPHTVHCAPDGHDYLAQGREDFEAYRRVKLQEIQDKSQGYRLPSAPVAFIRPKRTEFSVLLIVPLMVQTSTF